MFDTISGLPLHPLVVHAAVVLYPLGIIGLLAVLLVPRLRRHYGWPSVVALAVGAVFVFVSKESGEALAHRVGEPKQHAQYADVATLVAFVLTLVTLAWWILDRLHARRSVRVADAPGTLEGTRGVRGHDGATAVTASKPSALTRVLGALAGLLGLAGLVTMVLVGHSGATAVWADQMGSSTDTTSSASASASTTTSGTATSGTTAAAGSYTLAQVAEHKDSSSCWVAIKAPGQTATKVYDLTKWISQHPGGEAAITGLCGTDGTAAFVAKHGDDGANGRPEQALASFAIGTLAG